MVCIVVLVSKGKLADDLTRTGKQTGRSRAQGVKQLGQCPAGAGDVTVTDLRPSWRAKLHSWCLLQAESCCAPVIGACPSPEPAGLGAQHPARCSWSSSQGQLRPARPETPQGCGFVSTWSRAAPWSARGAPRVAWPLISSQLSASSGVPRAGEETDIKASEQALAFLSCGLCISV